MIYDPRKLEDDIDQGDLIDGCPAVEVLQIPDNDEPESDHLRFDSIRAIVLTQTCDLANAKTELAVVARVFDAQFLVDRGILKAADIRGVIRANRMWGLYFLPADSGLGLPEMIVDFRRLHTVRLDLLRELCRTGRRRGRVRPLYREHLAKFFADGYSRIGLPRPYETM